MERAGWRLAGDGAQRAASRISLTSASGTIPGLNARTARRVRMSAPIEPRTSTLTSRLHDHVQSAVDPLVERPEGFRELGQLEVVRDELCGRDAAVRDERDHLFHRVAVRADAVEIDLLEDDLLESHGGRLLGDAGDRAPPAFADHPDRLTNGVLRACGIDGDARAKTAGELANSGHRVAVVVVDGLEAQIPRTVEAFPAADDDAPRGAERPCAHRGEEAHPAGADRNKDVARIDAGPLHRVQRDRRRVAECRDVEWHRVRDLEDAFDRVDDVRRVRALRVVAVLPMAEVLPAVVEAEVVATGAAHPAVAAARVARAGDPRSRREAVAHRDLARFDDVAGPLVPGDERVGARPTALERSLDDLGVGPADRDRAHAREHLVRCGTRDRHVLADLERVRSGEHQRLHRRGLLAFGRAHAGPGWYGTPRP